MATLTPSTGTESSIWTGPSVFVARWRELKTSPWWWRVSQWRCWRTHPSSIASKCARTVSCQSITSGARNTQPKLNGARKGKTLTTVSHMEIFTLSSSIKVTGYNYWISPKRPYSNLVLVISKPGLKPSKQWWSILLLHLKRITVFFIPTWSLGGTRCHVLNKHIFKQALCCKDTLRRRCNSIIQEITHLYT